jgi:hypothetical protein
MRPGQQAVDDLLLSRAKSLEAENAGKNVLWR